MNKFRGKNIFKVFKFKNIFNGKTKPKYRTTAQIVEQKSREQYETVTAPTNFSFIKNPEETIIFINKLEDAYLHKRKAYVNLEPVKFLDYSAVTVLLSVMYSFKKRKIPFNGNFPLDDASAQLLVDSEFFKYFMKQIYTKQDYKPGKHNQIFTGHREVNSELGIPVMMESSKTIWGAERTCPGLQRILIELMQNTNNHASKKQIKGEKHWWLSVNHDKKNKKVSFSFVDYGVGIFESLKNKPAENIYYGIIEKFFEKVAYGGNTDILKLLLEGNLHRTVTGLHYRGKGLPSIKKVLDRNQVSKLKIISNNVNADVSTNSYLRLKNEFSGTFVTWELNELNENFEWIL